MEARGDRRVAGDFARFPSTYGRRSPDRCPPSPLPSTSLPIFHLSKAVTLFLPLAPTIPSATALMWTQGCKFSLVRNSGQEIRRASPSHRNTREAWEIWGWYGGVSLSLFPRRCMAYHGNYPSLLRPATSSRLPSRINAHAHAGMTWMPLRISAWYNKDMMASAGLRAVRSWSYRLVAPLSRIPERGCATVYVFTYKVEGLAFWLILC